jgi:hypothetical protein
MNPDWIDQARRLLDALRAGPAPTAADAAPADDAPDGGHSSDCRWCPLCQAAAVVRGERPEVTAALADVLAATATALRTFAAAGAPPPGESGSEATEDERPDTDDPPAVQRIEIA